MALHRNARVFSLVVVVAHFALATRDASVEPEIPLIGPEEECLAAGGHCVHSSKCPPLYVSENVECSAQKDLGAVCCHSALLVGETNCETLAGECMDECPENLTVVQAKNCPESQACCTLV